MNDTHELNIVMEYAQGGDLSTRIKECRKNKIMIPENLVIKFFYQLTSALRELHEKKIIHRDLKTANIFMS
jgi:NIMA (never in mitosis gene a)-related kinase